MDGASELRHATVIAVGGRAALITGPSGSGKSDLALRCLTRAPSPLTPTAARLVCDDQVRLERRGDDLVACAPPQIAGKLEVRGLGILNVDPLSEARVVLVAKLSDFADVERLPDPWPRTEILGLSIPLLRLWPFAASAPDKLVLALTWTGLPPVSLAR